MEKKKRNAPGTVHIEDVKLEGGITIPIILHKEDGIFRAHHNLVFEGENTTHYDGKSWEDKDLDKVRKDIKQWHQSNVKLKWEPMIILHPSGERFGSSRQKKVLGSAFERMLRAKKLKSDDYEWRTWAYSKSESGSSFVYDHDLEVYPPGATASAPEAYRDEETPVVIAYTPERWHALLQLIKMEEALRERLSEIMKMDEPKLDVFFKKIQSGGLLAFGGLKPKEKSDA